MFEKAMKRLVVPLGECLAALLRQMVLRHPLIP